MYQALTRCQVLLFCFACDSFDPRSHEAIGALGGCPALGLGVTGIDSLLGHGNEAGIFCDAGISFSKEMWNEFRGLEFGGGCVWGGEFCLCVR